jgi:large subunit ribosomal protein L21
MFAVVKTGGKQYKVAKNSIIKVEKIEGIPGSKIELDQILMLGEASKASFIGTPIVKGASVTAEIISQFRDDKIIILLNKQIKNELDSSQLYRAISCWLDNEGWLASSKYFNKKAYNYESLNHQNRTRNKKRRNKPHLF